MKNILITTVLCCGLLSPVSLFCPDMPKTISNDVDMAQKIKDLEARVALLEEKVTLLSDSTKVVYFDQVVPKLEQWNDEVAKAQSELASREAQIQSLNELGSKKLKELESMGSAANSKAKEAKQEEILKLKNEIEIKARSLQEFEMRTFQEMQAKIAKEIEAACKKLAKDKKGTRIIMINNTLFVDDALNISKEVVDVMNAQYAAEKKKKAPAPKAEVKEKPALNLA